MSITVNATEREDQGKGASRRLRKEEKVPSIIYGGKKEPQMVTLSIHEITHLLEDENTFTSVLDLVVGESTDSVVLKDIQRHPAKNTITHVDFLRVDAKQTLVTTTPLHFVGVEENEALRLGNMLNQFVVSIEISCLPKDLPHGIDVDVSSLEVGDHLSLTDLVLPEGVVINALQHEDVEAHDQTVCSVSEPKVVEEEEEIIEDGESEEGGEDSAEDSADSADSDSKDGDDNE
ncbi:50S ribosomal protein L25/general stress protein Ctc [Pseudothioglobus sp. nBUS_23]|jgi:large subunit ribosomal protein L25|uniref:50S ribosomal protein L25/general stress protein Ctc n=1 Tax=Pseudothioglobus sp. nBUS_23 TaxID=3395318 RepID=UPI003EB70382|tara:strand:- start:9804 stop:10502 length:699 start_codon:yes stop_codon:yes gene_type:complete